MALEVIVRAIIDIFANFFGIFNGLTPTLHAVSGKYTKNIITVATNKVNKNLIIGNTTLNPVTTSTGASKANTPIGASFITMLIISIITPLTSLINSNISSLPDFFTYVPAATPKIKENTIA